MTQTRGKVYAEALFGLSREEACEEQIYKECHDQSDARKERIGKNMLFIQCGRTSRKIP